MNIYHSSGIEFLRKLILVIFIKVDVESSKYQNNISCLDTTKIELFRYVLFIISDSDRYPVLDFDNYKLKLNPGCPFLF